ncbi:MAG: hypothetical protein GEU88_14160 [Solirubrobacterales bacterium]|nr:hypothetical protein [Solirubrobacterales bacterium]
MAVAAAELVPAISNGDVILIVVAVAIPIAALAFVLGAGGAFRRIGKGPLSVEFESDLPRDARDSDAEAASPQVREAEIRQLLEAKAYRQSSRGEAPVDVDAELGRLLAESGATRPADDPALRAEVRQLVVARNERRARQGQPPLDVEAEVERQLQELEGLE